MAINFPISPPNQVMNFFFFKTSLKTHISTHLVKFGQIFKIFKISISPRWAKLKKKRAKIIPPPQATTPHSDQKIADEALGTLINGRYEHIPPAIRLTRVTYWTERRTMKCLTRMLFLHRKALYQL